MGKREKGVGGKRESFSPSSSLVGAGRLMSGVNFKEIPFLGGGLISEGLKPGIKFLFINIWAV